MDIVGPSFTKEIFYTARLFDVMEAVEMGLVNRVVENSELEFYVKDYAATIAANAPLTVDSIKFIVGEACKDESQRDMKHCDDVVQACFKSEDYKEGRAAFMEKRKPVFKGARSALSYPSPEAKPSLPPSLRARRPPHAPVSRHP
jgi:enoyl-CoA hydratase/carnithine racemase